MKELVGGAIPSDFSGTVIEIVDSHLYLLPRDLAEVRPFWKKTGAASRSFFQPFFVSACFYDAIQEDCLIFLIDPFGKRTGFWYDCQWQCSCCDRKVSRTTVYDAQDRRFSDAESAIWRVLIHLSC